MDDFRFLDLPPEIRSIIYKMIMPRPDYSYEDEEIDHEEDVLPSTVTELLDYYDLRPFQPEIAPICQVNHQIRTETLPMFFYGMDCDITVSHPCHLLRILHWLFLAQDLFPCRDTFFHLYIPGVVCIQFWASGESKMRIYQDYDSDTIDCGLKDEWLDEGEDRWQDYIKSYAMIETDLKALVEEVKKDSGGDHGIRVTYIVRAIRLIFGHGGLQYACRNDRITRQQRFGDGVWKDSNFLSMIWSFYATS